MDLTKLVEHIETLKKNFEAMSQLKNELINKLMVELAVSQSSLVISQSELRRAHTRISELETQISKQ